jgi:hypothetical protein
MCERLQVASLIVMAVSEWVQQWLLVTAYSTLCEDDMLWPHSLTQLLNQREPSTLYDNTLLTHHLLTRCIVLCILLYYYRMGKDHRVTLSRRHAYRTLNNRVKTIKTPGGRFTSQLIKKTRKGAMCGDCGIALPGVSVVSCHYHWEERCTTFLPVQ